MMFGRKCLEFEATSSRLKARVGRDDPDNVTEGSIL